ncbi:MAG: sigma-70 family RNA polymerase sigma factor [Ignavibacteriales bacterium]|nr:sigma-70 family RNA polymerase sigma factor [Ignavibacteriales bacterium]
MISHLTDHEVIKRAKQGDDRAFTELVKRNETLVYSFAYKVCRDSDKASETWQDTFVNVYRKLHQFDGRSKFTTWLYSVVVNSCRMKRRQRKLDKASISIDSAEMSQDHSDVGHDVQTAQTIPSWRDTPLDKVMDKELRSLLDSAIQKLPYDYRLVFLLRDVEGLSAEEAGKILKLSVPAVKSRLRRARVFLREQLNSYMAI